LKSGLTRSRFSISSLSMLSLESLNAPFKVSLVE